MNIASYHSSIVNVDKILYISFYRYKNNCKFSYIGNINYIFIEPERFNEIR